MTDRVHSMRWREEDWANVEHLAGVHNLSVPDLFRFLVARELDAVGGPPPARKKLGKVTPFELNVLAVLVQAEAPLQAWNVLQALYAPPFNMKAGSGKPGNGVSAALERLRRGGYVARSQAGYAIADAGRQEVGE